MGQDGAFAVLGDLGVFDGDEKSVLFERPTVLSGARVFAGLEGLCSFNEDDVPAFCGNSKYVDEGGLSAFSESPPGVSGAGLSAVPEEFVAPNEDGMTPGVGGEGFSIFKESCDGSSPA